MIGVAVATVRGAALDLAIPVSNGVFKVKVTPVPREPDQKVDLDVRFPNGQSVQVQIKDGRVKIGNLRFLMCPGKNSFTRSSSGSIDRCGGMIMLRRRALLKCVLVFAVACAFGARPARAQALGLGGYGAMTQVAPASLSTGGLVIPFGGSTSGFMPTRMGGGGASLSFSSRNSSMVGAARSSFRLSGISREMSMPPGGFGRKFGGRAGMGTSLLSSRNDASMNRSMEMRSEGVMPPNFGYPFYQPPSLLGTSSAFMGMSSM